MNTNRYKTAGIILFLAAVLTSGFLIFNQKAEKSTPLNKEAFPQSLQGLKLEQIITDPQAMAMISKLHGSNISVKQGYIASYTGQQGQIMLWVSESENVTEAKQLFKVMDDKIAAANNPGQSEGVDQPPFTDRRELKEKGIEVIAVQGMGMENYYYQIGDKVYWIAVKGVDPLLTLRETIDKI